MNNHNYTKKKNTKYQNPSSTNWSFEKNIWVENVHFWRLLDVFIIFSKPTPKVWEMIFVIFKTPNSKVIGIRSFENDEYHFSHLWVWFTKYYENIICFLKNGRFLPKLFFSKEQLLLGGFLYFYVIFVYLRIVRR